MEKGWETSADAESSLSPTQNRSFLFGKVK